MRDVCVEMLHLADTSAQADFISSVQLQILRILGQTTADLNCKPTSAAITILRTYLEWLRLTRSINLFHQKIYFAANFFCSHIP